MAISLPENMAGSIEGHINKANDKQIQHLKALFCEVYVDASIADKISERFQTDENLMDILEPFVAFDPEADLRKIYEIFGSDLDLSNVQLQYKELIEQKVALKLGGSNNDVIKTILHS